jgi:hypothetical protein
MYTYTYTYVKAILYDFNLKLRLTVELSCQWQFSEMEDIDRLVTFPIRELSLHHGVKNSSGSHLASYPVSARLFLRSERESDLQISPIQTSLCKP